MKALAFLAGTCLGLGIGIGIGALSVALLWALVDAEDER